MEFVGLTEQVPSGGIETNLSKSLYTYSRCLNWILHRKLSNCAQLNEFKAILTSTETSSNSYSFRLLFNSLDIYIWLLAICFNNNEIRFIHKIHLLTSCYSQIISLITINQFFCVLKLCVFCEVRTAYMNII